MASTLSKVCGSQQSVARANGMAQYKQRGSEPMIPSHNAIAPTVGDGTASPDLGLLVLRLESYLTERCRTCIEFRYGPRTIGQSRRIATVGFTLPVTRRFPPPCRPHAEQGWPYHCLLLSSSSGKAESLYARLGCSMDRPRSCARLHAAPDIWIRRLKSDEGSRLFR